MQARQSPSVTYPVATTGPSLKQGVQPPASPPRKPPWPSGEYLTKRVHAREWDPLFPFAVSQTMGPTRGSAVSRRSKNAHANVSMSSKQSNQLVAMCLVCRQAPVVVIDLSHLYRVCECRYSYRARARARGETCFRHLSWIMHNDESTCRQGPWRCASTWPPRRTWPPWRACNCCRREARNLVAHVPCRTLVCAFQLVKLKGPRHTQHCRLAGPPWSAAAAAAAARHNAIHTLPPAVPPCLFSLDLPPTPGFDTCQRRRILVRRPP